MTKFTYTELRAKKGGSYLKKGDIVDWGDRRDFWVLNDLTYFFQCLFS